jgi:hypothetical protein
VLLTVLDPSLRDTHSHHHVLNQHLARRAAAAGFGFCVWAHTKSASAEHGFGYAAQPHFRRSIYEDVPSFGEVEFEQQVQAHLADLMAWRQQADPVARVVVHSVTAAFLQGLAQFWAAAPGAIKALAVELMFRPESLAAPGVDVRQAWLRYRYALLALRDAAEQAGARLSVATSCEEFAQAFRSEVMAGSDVGPGYIEVHPQALFSREDRLLLRNKGQGGRDTPGRVRVTSSLANAAGSDVLRAMADAAVADCPASDRIDVLLFAGDPKLEKGLAWVVRVLPSLLSQHERSGASRSTQFWLHLGSNRFDQREIESLYSRVRALQAQHDDLRVLWGYVPPTVWARMLAMMDAVVIPYDPVSYRHKTSGILGECLWRLRPEARLVLSGGGWLEREVRNWKLGFATCPYDDDVALLDCIGGMDRIPMLGDPAVTQPGLWTRHFGLGNDEWLIRQVTSDR